MSNHDGGRMLNRVIGLLEQEKVFKFLGKERSRQLMRDIIHLAERRHDCNSYEILEGYEVKFGLCRCCVTPNDDLIHGHCPDCREENEYYPLDEAEGGG